MKTATRTSTPAATPKPVTPATVTPVTDMPLRTKHVAAQFKLKPVQLRRILRTMPAYADGVHTNYKWAENDPRIAEIGKQIAKAAEDKAAKAKAAQDAIAAKKAQDDKAKAADAKHAA